MMFGVGFVLLPSLYPYFPRLVGLVEQNFLWLCFGIALLAVSSIVCAGIFEVE
jgi:hypothetical protein